MSPTELGPLALPVAQSLQPCPTFSTSKQTNKQPPGAVSLSAHLWGPPLSKRSLICRLFVKIKSFVCQAQTALISLRQACWQTARLGPDEHSLMDFARLMELRRFCLDGRQTVFWLQSLLVGMGRLSTRGGKLCDYAVLSKLNWYLVLMQMFVPSPALHKKVANSISSFRAISDDSAYLPFEAHKNSFRDGWTCYKQEKMPNKSATNRVKNRAWNSYKSK